MRAPSFLTMLLLAGTAHAGDPCAKGKMKSDPMTGASSLHFKNEWPAGFAMSSASFKLYKASFDVEGGVAVGKFTLVLGGAVDRVLPPGTPVKFRLDDGSLVELASREPSPAVGHASQGGVWSTFDFTAAVPPDVAKALAGRTATAVSVTTSEGEQSWAVNGGGQGRFAGVFACVGSLAK